VGTTFVVDLPYRRAGDNGQPAGIAAMAGVMERAHQPESAPAIAADEPIVLLVEDNDELAAFIAQSLPMTYKIHRAANGAEGFERALELMPDLVLSDVLMPVMDGYSLCRKLKTDQQTSHIPVILLTAKGEQESRTIGLTQGADDYITKPFHLPELQLRIRNQLYGRRRLREWVYHSFTRLENAVTSPDVTLSDAFLATLYGILDEHLDDSDFGVDELAAQIGMSRASLYRKIKAVTDLPVNELIRNYRLKRATHYLRRGQSVAETAYLVGFESPSYFTKCFRDLYQLTPSEFAEES
jgi:DNA-binding response OmpR family regulator